MKEIKVIKAKNELKSKYNANSNIFLRVAAYVRVSTDAKEQLASYNSQITYYTDLINAKENWVFVDMYADEALTGTNDKRKDFQRLMSDCRAGKIDLIITKSISRFARNTLDTLKYVRMLKELGVAVFFEEQNINTMNMEGELLLTILSSVAQQEVENISANVKAGLQMKMKRGEFAGNNGCLGYDYNKSDKTLTINEKEAITARYIFNRYVNGVGCRRIASELTELGYKTKKGNAKWSDSTVLTIIKNVKYKGDLLFGKTYSVDPISKRRLLNYGEQDQYYVSNNHEAIIDSATFDKAHEILKIRSSDWKQKRSNELKHNQKYSRQYAFSSLLKCGFCGDSLVRRSWNAGSKYIKYMWQCKKIKIGIKNCPHCKGIKETQLEEAFIHSYNRLCEDQKDIVEEFMETVEHSLKDTSEIENEIPKLQKEIDELENKRKKLVDIYLEGKVDKAVYEEKYNDLENQIHQQIGNKEALLRMTSGKKNIKNRLINFRKIIKNGSKMKVFEREVFESIIENVIIGGKDTDGNINPYEVKFIYKTGFNDNTDIKSLKGEKKETKQVQKDLYSFTQHNLNDLYSHSATNI